MANNSNLSSLDAMYKTKYLNRDMTDLTELKFPLTALMKSYTDWGGPALASTPRGGLHIPLKYANPPAVSQGTGGFTIAQNAATVTSSGLVAWDLLDFQTYGFVNIANRAILRSQGANDAFVNAKTLEIDGLFYTIARRLETYAFGDGTGVVALVGNSTQMPSFATNTCVLADPATIINIQPGDRLTVAATATGSERSLGSSLVAANGYAGLIVQSVNVSAGSFNVSDNAGNAVNLNASDWGIPAIAAGDYIAHAGARGAAQQGFQAYCPATAPASNDSFNNVNRSIAPDLLAGTRYNGASDSQVEAIMKGESQVAMLGGTVEECFTAFKPYDTIRTNLAARGIVDYTRVQSTTNPKVGFAGITVIGNAGEFDIVPAWACPSTLAALVGLSSWLKCSTGDFVRFLGGDGLEVLRSGTSDNIECRVGSYSNFTTVDPRSNANVTLATT